MNLTVEDLIKQLQQCNPTDYVYITTDWTNEVFVKATDVAQDQFYNPNADDFETKMYDLNDKEDIESNEDWEEIEAHGIKCVVIC